jgi:hypothetical protein
MQSSSLTHGRHLAARHGALSADHLEYATEEDAIAMAASGTVAVLFPARSIYCAKAAAGGLIPSASVPMALADANRAPPLCSLRLMLSMGCTLFGLTPEEALADHLSRRPCARFTGFSRHAGARQGRRFYPLAARDRLSWSLAGRRTACTVVYRGNVRENMTYESFSYHRPYDFTAGTSPLLISIPHAGTRLTPEVAEGLSEAAQPLGDTDWHIPACDFARALGASIWSAIIPLCYRSEPTV